MAVSGEYPASTASAALKLFTRRFGARYARSIRIEGTSSPSEGLTTGTATVGREWTLAFALADTLAADATVEWEAARAAVEHRLDAEGRSIALWVPRGGAFPAEEPGLSKLALHVAEARPIDDGRLEVHRPVKLYLRRVDPSGSVVTIMGGLGPHWAQFTNRVPGTFSLNSAELLRLPAGQDERDALAENIVLAANEPDIDNVHVIPAEDVWTANDLQEGGSCVLGTPRPETEESSALLRRNLRKLLQEAAPVAAADATARALILLGASTYAEEEKLSWAIRGMDPALYAGFDIIAVVADGQVKAILEPPRGTLPWDAPPA
ncbi:MAG: hypothetical protein HUU14_04835 [Dehalococcoidia bacterium]|nr:hypothetical protein [Chloroflexi bacterium CFX7]MCK6563644.1 hypothetical protein [Dehalococcoidia bacterium]NUQ55193.1 hypothetical protein [Dehalococcoidia bacterium]